MSVELEDQTQEAGEGMIMFGVPSRYPKAELFKPERLKVHEDPVLAIRQMHRRFIAIFDAPIPLTREEEAQKRSGGGYLMSGWGASDRGGGREAWVQKGPYWVRVVEGPNPHCWTDSRVGSHAKWRDAPRSWCGAGRPYFRQESIQEFAKTMEVFKPVLEAKIGGEKVLIALCRDIAGPTETNWGLRTGSEWWEVHRAGKVVKVWKKTKADLMRALLKIHGLQEKPKPPVNGRHRWLTAKTEKCLQWLRERSPGMSYLQHVIYQAELWRAGDISLEGAANQIRSALHGWMIGNSELPGFEDITLDHWCRFVKYIDEHSD